MNSRIRQQITLGALIALFFGGLAVEVSASSYVDVGTAYAGVGNIFEYVLIALALIVWISAVVIATTGKKAGQKIRRFFFTLFTTNKEAGTSFIDRSGAYAEAHSSDLAFAINEEDVSEVEDSELQSLRSQAGEEKIIFSESTLEKIALKASTLGGPADELMANVIESAKASYPRVGGYIRINNHKLEELL